MTVGAIEELEFMDLEICNTSTLREMRKVLAIFLSDLQDDVCDDDSCVSGGRNFGRSQSMPMPTMKMRLSSFVWQKQELPDGHQQKVSLQGPQRSLRIM